MSTMQARHKFITLLTTIPLLLFSGCAKTVDLAGKRQELAAKQITQGEKLLIFPDDRPSLPNGKIVWERNNCAQCHGADGKRPVDTNIVLNNASYMRKQKPIDLYMFITYGKSGVNHPHMHGVLTRRQIWDLVLYLRSLSSPPLTDKEYEQVDQVFGSNCAVCHGKKGTGDGPLAHNLEPVPANFSKFERFYDRTDDQLWDHIANGIKWEGMPNFLGKQDKAKKVKFDREYIWKLVQYVRQFEQSNELTAEAQAPETSQQRSEALRVSNNERSVYTRGVSKGRSERSGYKMNDDIKQ